MVVRLLVGDAEIGAGLAPFGTVRLDAPTPGAVVGDQVSEFVFEGALDLTLKVFEEWVELDFPRGVAGKTGRAVKAAIPVNADQFGRTVEAELMQPFPALFFQLGRTVEGSGITNGVR